MKLFYCDEFVLPLPPEHRFPMAKYRRLRERVQQQLGPRSLQMEVPEPATDAQLLRVHTPEYLGRVRSGRLAPSAIRRLGFPWSPALVERARRSVGGTIAACHAAARHGVAVNLAGGTHHAFADRGEGYCVFNDAGVAVRAMQAEAGLERALIIDCDVHQGNGTAAIFAGDEAVFTLSVHGARNYPFRKENSDLDVALADGTGDAEYQRRLVGALESALTRATPQIAVYVAGADAFEGDRLGRLALTKGGLRQRDEAVLGMCRDAGVPVAVTMAGGYSDEVDDIVEIHVATVVAAARLAAPPVSAR